MADCNHQADGTLSVWNGGVWCDDACKLTVCDVHDAECPEGDLLATIIRNVQS